MHAGTATGEAVRAQGSVRCRHRWRGTGTANPMNDRLLSQLEAARLAGCSRDTIARARRAGRLPDARLQDGHWVIPLADLVAAGLYRPAQPGVVLTPEAAADDPPAEIEHPALQLARAETRVAGLEALVARQDDELRFLRLTVETLAKRGAA